MEQSLEQRRHEFIVALKHRNWLFSEMEARVAAKGWKSRCIFSGEIVHCAVPEVAHHCLAGIRRQYVAATKRVRAARAACPEAIMDEEIIRFEKLYGQMKRRKSKSTAS